MLSTCFNSFGVDGSEFNVPHLVIGEKVGVFASKQSSLQNSIDWLNLSLFGF